MPARILEPLVGEPLPLDFVNTRPLRVRGVARGADPLADPDGLQQWLAMESDRLPYVVVTKPLCQAVIEVRAHVGSILDDVVDGATPSHVALDALNTVLRAVPQYAQLRWANGEGVLEVARAADPDAALLAALAQAAAEYLANNAAAVTRRCEAPDCDLLFASTHPRRRWCSPTVCGNRIRVARYYERHTS